MGAQLLSSLKDSAGILFGFTGFVISSVTLTRQFLADKKSKLASIKLKRLQALEMLSSREHTLIKSKDEFIELKVLYQEIKGGIPAPNDQNTEMIAEFNDNIISRMRDIENTISNAEKQMDHMREMRSMLKMDLPEGKGQQKVEATLDAIIVEMTEADNAGAPDPLSLSIARQLRTNLRLTAELKTQILAVKDWRPVGPTP